MLKRSRRVELSMILTFAILFASAFPVSAVQAKFISNDVISLETLVEKDNYSKIKVTNFLTGEIEFLETTSNEDGTRILTVTSNEHDKITTIEDNSDGMIVKENGKIIKIYSNEQIIKSDEVSEIKSDIGLFGYGSWSNPVTTEGHKALWVGITATVVVGIISGIFKLPADHSTVVGIVAAVIADSILDIWYKTTTQYRFDYGILIYQGRQTIQRFAVSNYTQPKESNTHYWTGAIEN